MKSDRQQRVETLERYLLIGPIGDTFDDIPELSKYVAVCLVLYGVGTLHGAMMVTYTPRSPYRELAGWLILGALVWIGGQLLFPERRQI